MKPPKLLHLYQNAKPAFYKNQNQNQKCVNCVVGIGIFVGIKPENYED